MSISSLRHSRISGRLRLLAATALVTTGLVGIPGFPGAPSASALPPPAPTAVSGTVFQDTRPNGVRDVAAPAEAGVQGVTVTAFDAAGAVAGTATSNASGDYSITPTGSGPWRVEFSNLPQDYIFGRQVAADKGTSVRFVSSLSTGNDLAVNLLGDYCQANPDYVTSCFTLGPTSLAPGSRQAVFSIPSTAKGYENTGGKYWTPPTSQALFTQVGAIFGMGYQASSGKWFGAAYLRRYTGFGPGGISAIYSTGGGTFIKLSDYGIDVGTDPHVLNAAQAIDNHDAPAFAAVGKIGLGDLDVSVDGTRLYTVNMNLKQLVSIPITRAGALNTSSLTAVAALDTVPGAQEIGVFTIPDAGCGANWRPMGIGMRGTSVFVGGTCSNQSVTIHKLNPATGAWTQSVATFNVGFTRQGGETFQAWSDTEGSIPNDAQIVRSQAMLADIAFDGQDLVLGLRDRFGDQTGYNTFTTNTADNTTRYRGQTAGDTLRACWNGGGWTLENNASCGTRTSSPGVANNDGPGGGEYYYQDHIQIINYDAAGNETVASEPGWHRNMSEGGLATSTFSGQVATTFMDPNDCWAQGVVWFDNGTGRRTQSWQFDRTANCAHGDGVNSPEGFGKANAMGDIEALCDEAPFEIGNRVWSDENRNGRQDANEPGIPGVTVQLFDTDGTTKLAEVTTDTEGNYVFSNAVGTDRADAKYGITGLKPGTTGYSVRVPSGQTALTQFTTTVANASAATGDGTATDSDSNGTAVSGNGATAAVDTGIAGTNDHSIDFGFYPRYELGNRVWNDDDNSGTINGTEAGIDGISVKLYAADNTGAPTGAVIASTTTAHGGYYRFDDLSGGRYVVVIASSNFGAANPLNGFVSSTGSSQEATADSDVDSNDNGLDALLGNTSVDQGGVASSVVTLSGLNAEPTNDADRDGAAATSQTTDGRSNLSVDFGFNRRYSLGNRVFYDLNNDGVMNGTEAGLNSVLVKLYAADGAGAPTGVALASDTTAGGGYYRFDGLVAGRYVVVVDGSNFAALAVLDEKFSSTGAGQRANADTDIDSDDNGLDTVLGGTSVNPGGIASGAVTLGPAASEPTNDSDAQASRPGEANNDQSNLTIDFGFYSNVPTYSLGNRVWIDTDNSGAINGSEVGVAGVGVTLYAADVNGDPTGNAISHDVTETGGYYRFDALLAGRYVVVIDRSNFVKDGVLFGKGSSTGAAQRADADSDIDRDDNGLDTPVALGTPGAGGIRSGVVTLGPANGEPTGETDKSSRPGEDRDFRSNLTVDFGFQQLPLYSLGNLVWVDTNNDGLRNNGETGLAAVPMKAYGPGLDGIFGNIDDELLAETTTNTNGYYLFTNLPPGDYVVQALVPAGYRSSTGVAAQATGPYEPAPDADNDTTDSDDNGNTVGTSVRSLPVTLGGTEPTAEPDGTVLADPNPDDRSNVTVDFGVYRPASIGDFVWVDTNRNGVQDPGETPVPGVRVQLLDMGGRVVAETTTDANGRYLFTNLVPGGYYVQFVLDSLPAGWIVTSRDAGSDDAADSDADPFTGRTPAYFLDAGDEDLTVDLGVLAPPGVPPAFPVTTLAPATTVPGTVAPTVAPTVPPTVTPTVAPIIVPDDCSHIDGTVFVDRNGNGKRDNGERGIPGVGVRITGPGGAVDTITNGEGDYSHTCDEPGEYRIQATTGIRPGAKPTTKVDSITLVKQGKARLDIGYVSADVQGEVTEAPSGLAFTGSSSTRLVLLAIGLILAGSALLGARRREQD